MTAGASASGGRPAAAEEVAVFHLTGARREGVLEPVDGAGLRPAVLAGYRDLTRLRYDFPLVLVEGTDAEAARSLSSIVDETLREVAPRGIEGERLRRLGLRLEREIRSLVAGGAAGSLSELWAVAAARLRSDEDESVEQALVHLGSAVRVDGAVVDCDHDLPSRLLVHSWTATQRRKAHRFHAEVDRLVMALGDILRAAFVHSEDGRRPDSLRVAVGDLHHDQFDFDELSRLLGKGAPRDELPPARRARIEGALEVLRRQRFFARPDGPQAEDAEPPHAFRFSSCGEAVSAFAERLSDVVELVRAMAVAELEADGRYAEDRHDPFFAAFGEDALTSAELALLPDYLVCIPPGRMDAAETGALMEVLGSDLPVKVLVETEGVLEESSLGGGHFGFGMQSTLLASTAMGLHDAFVLQTPSSNLYQLRDRVIRGLEHAGPALFSVFSGCADAVGALPAYLTAAAAMESRAFPAFTYDPTAGPDLAERFSLEDNPQPELDWPVEELEYADEALRRVTETTAFTVVDFAACDARFGRHFARVPRAHWNGSLVPVDEWLRSGAGTGGERVPYVTVVDDDDVLHRLVVDAKLMQAARRCREVWHGLQELGGIHNSHAERLLAAERATWEATREEELLRLRSVEEAAPGVVADGTVVEAVAAEAVEAGAAPEPGEVEAAEERPSDEPWIETARCSTCNECTNLNDRMFAYNENKQAYIKDPDAGTYRELVEAAEACQVAVIHPGKPRNPDEPGLEELLERAKPFA